MTPAPHEDLTRIYGARFEGKAEYRQAVWRILVEQVFSGYIPPAGAVLDLGCSYGEFINAVQAATRIAIDMNHAVKGKLAAGVRLLLQDCSTPWEGIDEASLDVVFTSNFLEHLPNKAAVASAIRQARRSLKPGGRFIAVGPNIKYIGRRYWDFWDHQVPLTESSLSEGLRAEGFDIERCVPRFLPFTMSTGPQYPLVFLKLYLALPMLWKLAGCQFLIVARR